MSEPPFYVLSEGQSNIFSTHDTSRAGFHHKDLAAFSEDVNNAARRAFPNQGRSRYETVNVCLIRWEDDELGVERELNTLNDVFQDYGFRTNVFLIPNLNSHWDLMRKALDFIQDCDNNQNLFILYYAGHGRMNSARQAEWVFRQGPDSPFVDWSAVQGLFGTAKSDVLILLDTCAAASSATTSQFAVMETIAACGFERRAPPPGEHSMTNTLIDVLRDWINKPSFSAASLHTEVLFRLKLKETKRGREGIPLEWCVTPVHWINAKDLKATGIEICKRNLLASPSATSPATGPEEEDSTFVDAMDIDFNDANSASTPLSSLSSTGAYKVPHVLISLQLEENQQLDATQCARWLDKFPLLAKWVKVEAVFPNYSTLMILSVPMPIWDMLPNDPACSFIGYATAPELGAIRFRSPGGLTDVVAPDVSLVESRISDSGAGEQAKEKEMSPVQKQMVKAAEKEREASRMIEAMEMKHMRLVKDVMDQEKQRRVREQTILDQMEEDRRWNEVLKKRRKEQELRWKEEDKWWKEEDKQRKEAREMKQVREGKRARTAMKAKCLADRSSADSGQDADSSGPFTEQPRIWGEPKAVAVDSEDDEVYSSSKAGLNEEVVLSPCCSSITAFSSLCHVFHNFMRTH